MAAILHVDGEQYLADLFAGADYEAGLGDWEAAISDTYAAVAGEPNGNGYSRYPLISANADLTVDVMPSGDGYRVFFIVAFSAVGGAFPRVKRIFIGSGTNLIFSIPITSDMVDPEAGLNWNDETGLLIPDGCTFQPLAPLYICCRNAAAAGETTAPKPAYNTPLDPENAINVGVIFCSWMVPDGDGQLCEVVTDVSGNELHGLANNLAPIPPVTVSGATGGNAVVNGDYAFSGNSVWAKAGYLIKKQPEYFPPEDAPWVICSTDYDPMIPAGTLYFTSGTVTSDPTTATWTGITVAEGEAAAGPWTEDGLKLNGVGYVDLSNSSLLNPQVELPPVVVSASTHTFLNQDYNKVSAYQWTSADGLYRISRVFMAWPEQWEICTIDYNPEAPAGTSYHVSAQPEPLPAPWLVSWTGVTVALGEVTPEPGDPTGFSIHLLARIETAATNCHWVSRWGTNAAADAYVLEKYNGAVPQVNVYGRTGSRDVIPVVHDQVVALTYTWDGATAKLYRDGVQVTVAAAFDSIQNCASTKTTLGAYLSSGSPASISDDEILFAAIWQRGLTAAEVKTMAANPYGLALGS